MRIYCAMHKNRQAAYPLINNAKSMRKMGAASALTHDFCRIERWSSKRADVVRRFTGRQCRTGSQDHVVEVGPEHGLRCREMLRRELGLSPADHLAVEPGCVHRVGTRRA